MSRYPHRGSDSINDSRSISLIPHCIGSDYSTANDSSADLLICFFQANYELANDAAMRCDLYVVRTTCAGYLGSCPLPRSLTLASLDVSQVYCARWASGAEALRCDGGVAIQF